MILTLKEIRYVLIVPIIIATAIVFATSLSAVARGQTSYTLPEAQKPVPVSISIVTKSVWNLASDSPTNDIDNVVASGGGIVAFVWKRRVCGFDELSGRKRWCAGYGSGPAYANHEIAYSDADGSIDAVDSSSGANRWRFQNNASANRPNAMASPRRNVWSANNDFLVAVPNGGKRHNFGEIDADGKLLWSASLLEPIQAPYVSTPYALQLSHSVGASIIGVLQTVRLGRFGGRGNTFMHVSQVLATQLPHLELAGDWPREEIQDRFLTFDLESANIQTGELSQRSHFEPDYEKNYALYQANAIAGQGSPQIVVDSNALYAVIGNKLYRYRLANPDKQRPLLMATNIKLLGARKGAVYITRDDGVWKLTTLAAAIRAQRIIAATRSISAFAILGKTAFFGFEGGRVYGVDVDSGRTTFNARSCVPERIVAVPRRLYTLCTSRAGYQIFAFPRPA